MDEKGVKKHNQSFIARLFGRKTPADGEVKKIKTWTVIRIESYDQLDQAATMTKTSINSILELKEERGDVRKIRLVLTTDNSGQASRVMGTFEADSSKVNLIIRDLKKIGDLIINPKKPRN